MRAGKIFQLFSHSETRINAWKGWTEMKEDFEDHVDTPFDLYILTDTLPPSVTGLMFHPLTPKWQANSFQPQPCTKRQLGNIFSHNIL
jgi:hypothetical protein